MHSHKRKNKRGRPAAGQSISPQQIIEAALRIIEVEGIDQLSMRRLGQELGVQAMALYNHYNGKEAILDAVAGHILSEIPLPPKGGSWKSRIKTLCCGIRSAAQKNPNLFRVAMTRPLPPALSLPLIDAALSALAGAGLSLKEQAGAYHTLRLYVRAFCLWEIEEYINKPDTFDLASMMRNYPDAAEVVKLNFSADADNQFEQGINLILRGLSK